MKPPTDHQAATRLTELLADLFDATPRVVVEQVGRKRVADYAISLPGHRFVAEYRSNASASSVTAGIDQLNRCIAANPGGGLPLLVVPYMGSLGDQLCRNAAISWLDLSGNARVSAPGVKIRISGCPNKYLDRGRPPNIFAPKSSRIVRQLLFHPDKFHTQAELARLTRLGDGYVSKIVRRLADERYLETNKENAVRPHDPDLLLDAWYEAYDFSHHRITKRHVPARSGDDLLDRVMKKVSHEDLEWGVTGLGAAWQYTRFAAFRLATIYLSRVPSQSFLETIGFSEEPKGANLWLVLPDDDGVFSASAVVQGIRCVSAVQTY